MKYELVASLKKNKTGIILMVCSSLFACVGQLLWKLGTDQGLLYIAIGFFFYGIGAVVMLIAYKFGSLSVLQPILSLNYIISIFLGNIVLGEAIGIYKVLGICCIIAGALCIGGGDH